MNSERVYTLYLHINIVNNKKYIGITRQIPESRFQNGFGYRNCNLFFNAIKKYGWNNFNHEILLRKLTKEEAETLEVEAIKHYKSNNKKFGYNISNGGNTKGKIAQSTKDKISKANKGRLLKENNPMYNKTHTQESRDKISKRLKEYYKKYPQPTRVLSEETKNKISKSRIGKYCGNKHPHFGKKMSQETKDKISKSHTGFKHSEESKAKMSENRSGEKHFMYGKNHSEETKKKISKSHTGKLIGPNNGMYGKNHSEESKLKMSINKGKNVLCIDTGEIFYSCLDASKKLNIDYSYLSKACKNGKICKGLHFKYIEREIND